MVGKLTILGEGKPLIRRIADRKLVVSISADGILLRGLRRRVGTKFVTWEQLATLADESEPLLLQAEQRDGARLLAAVESRNGKR